MDVVLPMPAFPLAAGPDSLLPLPGRLQLVVGPVLPLSFTVDCGCCSAASVVSAGCD